MLTHEELKERLKTYDEVTLLEILNISAEDIVDRFEDFIDEKYEKLSKEEEEDSSEWGYGAEN